jgi:hypothetical protein
MIIFELDGTLADCEHRRHFVDPGKLAKWKHSNEGVYYTDGVHGPKVKWKPDWKAFYEACGKDRPIQPVLDAFIHLTQGDPFNHDVQIWSGRCESVREKTLKWLVNLTGYTEDYQYWDRRLKMRPIGDNTPDDQLKEKWLDELWPKLEAPTEENMQKVYERPNVDFVFDSDPASVSMWRRRGVFVFNCAQHDGEF